MNPEQRSLFLLLSLLLFFVLTPFLESSRTGELILVGSLYLTLVAAVLELAIKAMHVWSALPLAGVSMVLLLVSHVIRILPLRVASDLCLLAFLGLVSVSLFRFLGRPGAIASSRLYISVTLYLLLGLTWDVIYALLNRIQPGSFAEGGAALTGQIPPSKLLYFSLSTLTTLGYGDIVAIRPPARIFSALEAASGVLYIAIAVARLVAAYQAPREKET